MEKKNQIMKNHKDDPRNLANNPMIQTFTKGGKPMSHHSMRFSTNLYEEINEALKSIYLSQDEFEELSNAVSSYEEEQEDEIY